MRRWDVKSVRKAWGRMDLDIQSGWSARGLDGERKRIFHRGFNVPSFVASTIKTESICDSSTVYA